MTSTYMGQAFWYLLLEYFLFNSKTTGEVGAIIVLIGKSGVRELS